MSHDHDDPRYPVRRSDAEWRASLTPAQYQITRQAATERAFTGDYWDFWQDGHYRCVCCGHALFAADTKFDAGCGWPSFWAELAGAGIERLRDASHGMERTELRCSHCGAHLGHVFPDGPQPTGERYCINSASIAFEGEAPPATSPPSGA
ncbi:peptide-methionine (R)-S-oxide reductase MsrB [Amphibiibacter pelophylacis]|uniref:Peptide-methionine (R)-S-oxide reductase MsrB n=1 Tax=Amphibiibacter pelophylacis TaxID=1799477 RepID=A0ACC6P336_9BURK